MNSIRKKDEKSFRILLEEYMKIKIISQFWKKTKMKMSQ
jgi:hypothetical protein